MTRSISEKIDRTVLFQGCHGQFLVCIKQPGLGIFEKNLLNDQYYIFFFKFYNRDPRVSTLEFASSKAHVFKIKF